ncbi:hypothetical protein F441_15346 [Phytophthora nicotianae CJ01A1]|uniref:Zinc finger PHD-type domain-containing protein n=2 Tax=Phytophthora nicotianae TaxID=4792 RepID=W2IFZ2_PHYNI|nr:hypothetical protein L915_15078 [Phytophthora nicotianae]ETL32462.1 hypothetical protein L916_14973 [Phytophthora nicotianae]ETP08745.1 hypothetical protein F441_15346 [Phytophthora nicotianae CJ01A1]
MADSTPAPLSCPVCFERFPTAAGTAFALHLASCSRSSPSPPGSPTSAAHCPRCFHVYAAGTLAHEISFHEHECARVNDLPDAENDESASSTTGRKPKRQRNDVRVEATPSVTLFPSHCFLCGNGGRGLLHCSGSCARAAHQNCVDQLQAPTVGEPLSVAERKQAAENWKCAQCLRGLHRCQRCGFLGHEANGMRKCSVLDCGYHFHEQCLETDETTHTGFVCPRHTCATCGTQETDMRRCKSCSVCYHMTHFRCPRGSGASTGASTNNGGLDPINLFVCPRHDAETSTSPTSSPDASNSLRQRIAAGDVVLVLEFTNALLPSSAKQAAPDAVNHWGVVVSAEETEPHGRGSQLLSVRMFADENVLVVPNQYALRVATASDFSRPVDLIRHCLQRHAMVELQLRQMEGNVDEAEEKRILRSSTAAFAARLKALGVTAAQATSDAEQGLARWRQFQTLPEPRHYDGLGDAAPSYLYIDTRGSRPGQQASNSGRASGVTTDADGDVSMTDPDTDSGGATANGPTRGSPHARAPSRPKNAGRSPHEGEAEKPTDTPGVDANSSVQESQNCTQDTVMTDTQDTQQDSDSCSQASATVRATSPDSGISNHTIGPDANRNKRSADVIESGDVKRQKVSTESPALETPVFTPTNFCGLQPGATLSSASAPATLHISPMASSSRTILPQKRKQLTRKQKLLADMPKLVLEDLERTAFRYLEEADASRSKPAPVPTDSDAFPWAARAANFRPAFYRPTVMLGHSGLRRPGVDAVSRLLVSQDKRSIKCFVQTLEANEDLSKCSHVDHLDKKASSASPGFVLLDLMTLSSFRELELVVRTRLVEALGKYSRYTRDHFGMDAYQAQRWLEQQRRRKASDQPPISLSYCAVDGVRRHIELKESTKQSPKDKQKWLCFCANVRHLSVAITVPNVTRSALKSMVAPQQVAGTAK